jgi:RNA polymerase sigma factor (sigma-70 family)
MKRWGRTGHTVVVDDAGFESLYTATWRDILGYALRRIRDEAGAADVAAEVFAVAWRRRTEIPPPPRDRLWLFGVARLTVANHRRGETRRARLATVLREQIAELVPDPAAAVLARQDAAVVLDGLRQLDPVDRELLTLVAWEQLSPTEAAVVVGINASTARVRLHRARNRLRRLLDEPTQRHTTIGHVRVNGYPPVPAEES